MHIRQLDLNKLLHVKSGLSLVLLADVGRQWLVRDSKRLVRSDFICFKDRAGTHTCAPKYHTQRGEHRKSARGWQQINFDETDVHQMRARQLGYICPVSQTRALGRSGSVRASMTLPLLLCASTLTKRQKCRLIGAAGDLRKSGRLFWPSWQLRPGAEIHKIERMTKEWSTSCMQHTAVSDN